MKRNLFLMASGLLLVLFLAGFSSQFGAKEKEHKVKISTIFGDMIVKLYNDTPNHRDNFLQLAKEGAYDGTIFHRVINGFMMQGGDLDSKGAAIETSLGYGCFENTLKAEFRPHLFHKKGALAAARQPDSHNPNKESSACQFYIVQGYRLSDAQLDAHVQSTSKPLTEIQRAWYKWRGGTPFLDQDYTVFGEVIEGLEVIDLVCSGVRTNSANRPLENIEMTVEIIE